MARSIQEAVSLIGNGTESLKSFADASLRRIKDYKYLNAFTYVGSEKEISAQLKNFESSSSRRKHPSLLGMPVAVKDNFCFRGMPTTCGSKMLFNFKPPYTATVVQKLVDDGAVIVGKTNLDEFGMGNGTVDSLFGATKNVWGLDAFRNRSNRSSDWHVPGGSSGGSAVAVAAGLCYAYVVVFLNVLVAIGSDTGGSTRNPASYCGVVGLKPTYGLISRYGLIPLVNSMDVPGILTRTVDDCVHVFNAVNGYDPLDSTSIESPANNPISVPENPIIEGLRIGLPDEYVTSDMSSEVLECWKAVADLLKAGGAAVEKVSLPHTPYSIACYSVLNPCEVASNMARYDGLKYGHRSLRPEAQVSTEALYAHTRQEGFNAVVRGRILTGNYFLLKDNYEKFFGQAMKLRRLISSDFDNLWKSGIQLLLTPVTLTTAPKYSDFIRWDNRKQSSVQDYCTQPANMAGIPAVSIPIKLDSGGLPLSIQLMGPHFSEELIFTVAKYIESQVKFVNKHCG